MAKIPVSNANEPTPSEGQTTAASEPPRRKVVTTKRIVAGPDSYAPGDDISHLPAGTIESLLMCKDARYAN